MTRETLSPSKWHPFLKLRHRLDPQYGERLVLVLQILAKFPKISESGYSYKGKFLNGDTKEIFPSWVQGQYEGTRGYKQNWRTWNLSKKLPKMDMNENFLLICFDSQWHRSLKFEELWKTGEVKSQSILTSDPSKTSSLLPT